MDTVRWGIIGCGDVTEVKSGPAFQKASGSALIAVMRRDGAKALDYARRHGVPRAYDRADDLIQDSEVDAVYIATPPSSHAELALKVADAGKPCLVEKPMALTYAECERMVHAFAAQRVPLWVAYYRRALPRFLTVRSLLTDGAVGRLTSVHVVVSAPIAPEKDAWRLDPSIAGAGLFYDLGSHCVDLVDFLAGPLSQVSGFALNTGRRYRAEDVTTAAFTCGGLVAGTGTWNFNASRSHDGLTFVGTEGELWTPIFGDTDVTVTRGVDVRTYHVRNPPHVHQPLVQGIVDELRGVGQCDSTGESGARASWVLERCISGYYSGTKHALDSVDNAC